MVLSDVLDYESGFQLYKFGVTATDSGGYSSRAIVVVNLVNINEYPPQFDRNYVVVSVDEPVEAGSQLITVEANDNDNKNFYRNMLNYRIISSSLEMETFSINSSGSICATKTVNPFELHNHHVTVIAIDEGGLTSDSLVVTFSCLTCQFTPYTNQEDKPSASSDRFRIHYKNKREFTS